MKIALAVLALVGGGMFVAFGGLQTLETLGALFIVGVIALAAIALGSLNISHSAIGQGNSVTHQEYYSVHNTTKSGGSFVDEKTRKFMGGRDNDG